MVNIVNPTPDQVQLAKELASRISQVAAPYPLVVQNVAGQMFVQALLAVNPPAQRGHAMALFFKGIRENLKGFARFEKQHNDKIAKERNDAAV